MAALPRNDISDPPYNTGTGTVWRMGGSTSELYERHYNYNTNDSAVYYCRPISASMMFLGGAQGITVNTNGWRFQGPGTTPEWRPLEPGQILERGEENQPSVENVEDAPKPFKPIRDGLSRRIL